MKSLGAFALFIAFTFSVFCQDYEIRLTRPMKAGDKYGISATASSVEISTTAAEGEEPDQETEKTSIELEGLVNVIEVDKKGAPSKEMITIGKCVVESDGQKSEPFKKGAVITAFVKGDDTFFEVEGKPVSEELSNTLGLIEILDPSDTTDDDVFGTKERRKIGDTWNMNPDPMPADFAKSGIKVDKKNIKGSATLEKLVKSNGKDCLQISAEITMKDVNISDLPAGFTVKNSVMMGTGSSIYPVDTSMGILEETTEMKLQMTISGRIIPGAPDVKIITTTERSSTQKYTYDKSKPDDKAK
ncbi:MAG TPA: hypothetical protein DCZ94_12620 [Lentisphaeria bacterium]|nr:MAG: hypothetical protein A2X48_21310 [Lentisphaerae bacterium GWF2_49_21]HBC87790.1 hypothetical protein [Lentisphaeria bacterium]